MRRIVLPTLACLALLIVGTTVSGAEGPGFVRPPGLPGFSTGSSTEQDLPMPTLPVNEGSDTASGLSLRSAPLGVTQSRGATSGGGSMPASGHVVVQKTVVLEEKVKEARRELERPAEEE